ncbi:MAG: tetratricopeptide repeat protein [Planctomycetota bacterium]
MMRALTRPILMSIALAALAGAAISQQPRPAPPKPAVVGPRARGFAALNERLHGEPVKEVSAKQVLARASQPLPPPVKLAPEGADPGRSAFGSGHVSEDELQALMQLGMIDPFTAGLLVPGQLRDGAPREREATEIPAAPFPPETLQKMLIVGDLAFRKGLMPRAVTAYERAAAMQPDSVACQLALAEAALAGGQYAHAAELVEAVLKRSPSALRVTIDRAGLYPSPAKLETAERELRQYVLDHREERNAVLLLGYVLVSDGKDAAEARLVVRAAGELLGDDPAVNVLKKKLGITTAPAHTN